MTEKIKQNIANFKLYIQESQFKDELSDIESMLTEQNILLGSLFFDENNIDSILNMFVKTYMDKNPDELKLKYSTDSIDELKEHIKLLFLF